MRTQDEIVARYEAVRADDFLGTIGGDLIPLLDFERARPYLKPETTPEQWAENTADVERTDDAIRAALVDYLPFAWEKAIGERGISAGRSVQHFQSWLWLLGDDDLLAFAEADANYAPYGKPILRRIAERYAPEFVETMRAEQWERETS